MRTRLAYALHVSCICWTALEAVEEPPLPVPPNEAASASNESADTQFIPLASPTVEWAFHKTDDGAHPNGNEQAMVWLMNRARTDPEGEGAFLAAIDQSNVTGNYSFWDVDLDKIRVELASLSSRPPSAFDRRLYEASKAHSD